MTTPLEQTFSLSYPYPNGHWGNIPRFLDGFSGSWFFSPTPGVLHVCKFSVYIFQRRVLVPFLFVSVSLIHSNSNISYCPTLVPKPRNPSDDPMHSKTLFLRLL